MIFILYSLGHGFYRTCGGTQRFAAMAFHEATTFHCSFPSPGILGGFERHGGHGNQDRFRFALAGVLGYRSQLLSYG